MSPAIIQKIGKYSLRVSLNHFPTMHLEYSLILLKVHYTFSQFPAELNLSINPNLDIYCEPIYVTILVGLYKLLSYAYFCSEAIMLAHIIGRIADAPMQIRLISCFKIVAFTLGRDVCAYEL